MLFLNGGKRALNGKLHGVNARRGSNYEMALTLEMIVVNEWNFANKRKEEEGKMGGIRDLREGGCWICKKQSMKVMCSLWISNIAIKWKKKEAKALAFTVQIRYLVTWSLKHMSIFFYISSRYLLLLLQLQHTIKSHGSFFIKPLNSMSPILLHPMHAR